LPGWKGYIFTGDTLTGARGLSVQQVERRYTMAISGKYGKMDIPKIGGDEPVFILRAQDRLAQGIIEIYKLITSQHGSHLKDGLDKEIERFRNWPGPKKMPD
jgi:hypothetical protein